MPARSAGQQEARDSSGRKTWRYYLALTVLSAGFGVAGINALLVSQPASASGSLAQGGIVVLTSDKGMTVSVSMKVQTGSGLNGSTPTFDLILGFHSSKGALRQLYAQTPDGIPFEMPFQYAVIFSGSAAIASDAQATAAGETRPIDLTCNDCGDPQVLIPFERALFKTRHILGRLNPSLRRISKIPQLGSTYYFHAGSLYLTSRQPGPGPGPGPYQVTPAATHAAIGDAYGYTTADASLLRGATTTGHLDITGLLAQQPGHMQEGREDASLATVPLKFPTNVTLAADEAQGSYLILQNPADPKLQVGQNSTTYYPARVTSDGLTVTKQPFDRLDLATPPAAVSSDAVTWQRSAVSAPFAWELSNDAEISAAAARDAQSGLLAGVLLSASAALLVAVLQRLLDEWQTGVTWRRLRRFAAAIAAAAATLVLLTQIGDLNVRLSSGRSLIAAVTCAGPLSRPPASASDSSNSTGPSLCESARANQVRLASVAGVAALTLWLYVAWTGRRSGRRRIWRIVRNVLTVGVAAWAAEVLLLVVLVWRGGLAGDWLLAPLLVIPGCTAALAASRFRRREDRLEMMQSSRWTGNVVVAFVSVVAWLYPAPNGAIVVVGLLLAEVSRQWLVDWPRLRAAVRHRVHLLRV